MNIELYTALFFEMFAKSGAILLLALLVTRLLRKASAAQRHLIWLSAIVTLLLLPTTRLLTPKWHLEIAPLNRVEASAEAVSFQSPPIAVNQPGETLNKVHSPSWKTPDWSEVMLLGWLAGTLAVLGWRILGTCRLFLLYRASRPLRNKRVQTLADAVLHELEICRRIEIRLSDECCIPMTWGSRCPVILLPGTACGWSDESLHAVLRHEAGHIRRFDHLSRWITQFACALYWPNPLVWFAARRLYISQEQATDDIVLCAGTPTHDYASQLFETAQQVARKSWITRHALAMASPSTLKSRILAIVDKKRNRSSISRRMAVGSFAAVLTSLALCSIAQLIASDYNKNPVKTEPSATSSASGDVEIAVKLIQFDSSKAEDIEKLFSGKFHPGVSKVFIENNLIPILESLKEMKGIDMMAAPMITTKSEKDAKIEVIREFRYPTNWEEDNGKWKPSAFEERNLGIGIKVRPTINRDENIDLEVSLEIMDILGFQEDGKLLPKTEMIDLTPRATPIFSTRTLSSSATFKSGQTMMMAFSDSIETGEGKNGQTTPPVRNLLILTTAKVIGFE